MYELRLKRKTKPSSVNSVRNRPICFSFIRQRWQTAASNIMTKSK